ncbi:MAG: OmpA family protein [Bacteroidia bacterium]
MSFSQTFEYPWAVSGGMGMVKYQSPPGSPKLPGGTFAPAMNLGVSRYLAGGFDFRTQVLLSHRVNYPTAETVFNSQLIDMNYQLVFKFNNGVFLRESSRFGPYLSLGVGGSYMVNHPDVYIPLSGGIRFKLNERMSARVETSKKLSVNQDIQHIAHALAFVYNLDTKDLPVEPKEEEEMSEEMIVSALLPKDSDFDGVIDLDDQCPEEPGQIQNHGCPEGKVTDPGTVIASSEEVEEEPLEDEDSFDLLDTEIDEENGIVLFSEPENEDDTFDLEEDTEELDEDTEDFDEVSGEQPVVVAVVEDEPVKVDYPAEEAKTFNRKHHLSVLLMATPKAEAEQITAAPEIVEPEIVEPEIVEPESEVAEVEVTEAVAATTSPRLKPVPCSMESAHIDPVLFEVGSDKLSDEAKGVLDQLANMLATCPSTQLVLEGHADAVGTENSNLVLSIMRAYNVKYYLVYERGISQQRIRSRGMGEQNPLADNQDIAGRKQNRRVDFQLIF